jgi:hypothetical protein
VDFCILLVPNAEGKAEVIDGVTYRTLRRDDDDALWVAVASLPLPTGAATEATLDAIAGYVDQLEGYVDNLEDLLGALASLATDQLRVDVITPFTPTSTGNDQVTVAAAGTAEQLPDQSCKAVSIAALPTNTGYVYLGDSGVDSTNGRVLAAGDAIDVAIDNLNRLYVDADVNGEGISYLWVSS